MITVWAKLAARCDRLFKLTSVVDVMSNGYFTNFTVHDLLAMRMLVSKGCLMQWWWHHAQSL